MDFSYLNATSIRVAVGILTPLTVLTPFWRFWVRYYKKAPCRIDDFFVIPAALLTFAVVVAVSVGLENGGVGTRERDSYDEFESPEQRSVFIACLNAIQTLSCLAIGAIRLSLYFSYLRGRAWSLRDLKLTWGYWILIIMSALWSVAYFVLYLAIPPFPGTSSSGSNRVDVFTVAIGYAGGDSARESFVFGLWIGDAILNFITIFVAIPNMKFSNVSMGSALYWTGVIASGVVALAASIMRPVTANDWLIEFNNGPTWDVVLATSAIMLWSLVECSMGTVAASLTILSSPYSGADLENPSDQSLAKDQEFRGLQYSAPAAVARNALGAVSM